ncbi:MAG: cysteine-rich repeat protein [Myxococcales bacterium]|nr:cysteine-rich repeat protein [Myxococcales bacterium]
MPGFRAAVVAGCLSSLAFGPHAGPKISADTLTAMPAAGISRPLRTQPTLKAGPISGLAGTWEAQWDVATGVPSRIWGSGLPAPGSIAHADIAEAFARQVLATHLALLAPGAKISDFELVSNVFDGDIRAIGFVQRANGLIVVGGQISFRFKRDRLFVIGSEALPNVSVVMPTSRSTRAVVRDRATQQLRSELGLPNAPVSVLGSDVIVPLVADQGVLGYRLAAPLTIDGGFDGRYLAYADPATGNVIAVHQLNEYANGTLLYHGVDRYPGRGRIDRPAPRAHITVNGAAATTSPTGAVTWSPDAQASLQTSIVGDLAQVVNKAVNGLPAVAMLAIDPGGQSVWDASGSVEDDAQLNVYLDLNIVKDYVRANIDPAMPTLDDPMVGNVNLPMDCNAFFDGKAVNFFRRTAPDAMNQCENTGEIQDVVFHEYGHRVHTAEIINGVGAFDGAMSEGVADFLAASITGDSGMGRGFFFTDAALRELDPMSSEWMWPFDIGEIHHTGQIFGGTFWDLRKALIAQLGQAQGIALTNKLYTGVMRRAINIPTCLVEALATDDDDGDLSNGTPHECAIRDAFGRHGLRTATGEVVAPGTLTADSAAIGILITLSGLSNHCAGDQVAGAKLDWVPSYTGVPAAGTADATPAGPNQFFAELPLAKQEVVNYQVRVGFADGSEMKLADNLADPYYQLYQGRTIPLYCTSFETDPFADGWTTGVDKGESTWTWGTPTAGATDPHAAYSGTHILAQTLDGNYTASQLSWVKMPAIDIHPYSDVRLQYRRWLAVEDNHYDQARITANDEAAWQNRTQNMGDSSSYHHIDKEWRFQDVALSGHFTGKTLSVKWDLKSDGGLELGGWQLDDVCIVANPYAICGDGVKTPTEGCDNGIANEDKPNACRTDCRLPTCGDNIVDTGEECDEGKAGTPACSPQCKLIDVGSGGCCSSSGGGGGSIALGALALGLVFRRCRKSRAMPFVHRVVL